MKKWVIISAAILVLAGAGSLMQAFGLVPDSGPVNVTPDYPSVTPSIQTPQTHTTRKPVDALDVKRVEKHLKSAFGIKSSWQEACQASQSSWPCYVASVEAASPTTLLVTLQISDKDRTMGARAARSIDTALGSDFFSVKAIQVNNARGSIIGNLVR